MGTRSAVAPVKNQSLWRLPQMRQLLAISLLGFTSFCLTLAAVPTWAHAGGVAESAAGLPTTVMLASTVLTQAAVPRLVTRFGVGRTLAAGLVALGAPAPFCALSHQLAVLLPVAAVRGCGFAVLTVVGVTLTATVAPPDRHGESVGLYGLAIAVPNQPSRDPGRGGAHAARWFRLGRVGRRHSGPRRPARPVAGPEH